MKIDTDLRLAIHAAERSQRNSGVSAYQERYDQLNASVATFSEGCHGPMLRRTLREIDEHGRRLTLLHGRLGKLGLQVHHHGAKTNLAVSDERRYVKAGGVIPPVRGVWRAADVMAELLAADPRQRDAILRRHGIDWS